MLLCNWHSGNQKIIYYFLLKFSRKSFPSSRLRYYIKVPSELPNGQSEYLYAHSSGAVRISGDQPFPCASQFKFRKHSDGSFAIYSMSMVNWKLLNPGSKHSSHYTQKQYLQKSSTPSTPVIFSANDCDTINTKFELIFHQQNQQPGMLVRIRSLATDNYLSMMRRGAATADKFLIIPVVDGQ